MGTPIPPLACELEFLPLSSSSMWPQRRNHRLELLAGMVAKRGSCSGQELCMFRMLCQRLLQVRCQCWHSCVQLGGLAKAPPSAIPRARARAAAAAAKLPVLLGGLRRQDALPASCHRRSLQPARKRRPICRAIDSKLSSRLACAQVHSPLCSAETPGFEAAARATMPIRTRM